MLAKHSKETLTTLLMIINTLDEDEKEFITSNILWKGKPIPQSYINYVKALEKSKLLELDAESKLKKIEMKRFGSYWITNGKVNEKIPNNWEIPDGWWKGFTKKAQKPLN